MTNIYVDQFDSYPDELKECIKKYSTTIKKYINTGIERSDNAIESSLEWTSVFKDLELNKLFMEFWSIASKYFFIGYHVTRICSLAEIQKNGLLILEFENYKNRLSKVLQEHDISEEEIDYAMMRIKKMYDGYLGERKERICFFAPNSLLYSGNFDYFARNYGGEIAERAFENHKGMEKVWNTLTGIGKPVMVTFRFHLTDLYDFQYEMVFINMLRFLSAKMFMDYDLPIGIGQHIKKCIPPSDILAIQEIEIQEF